MLTNFRLAKRAIATTLAVALTGAMSMAMAADAGYDADWAKNHPRRAQVNHRLANQTHRIKKEVKEGELSKAKARQLHRQDQSIRREERAMAKAHHGHITKQEQGTLNRQENAVSKQIGQ